MADFIPGVIQRANQYESIGANYIRLNEEGRVEATTGNWLGRLFARVAARLSGRLQQENQATITALVWQLQSTPVVGQQLADSFRTAAAPMVTQGKPLSGRQISRAMSESLSALNILTLHNMSETYLRMKPAETLNAIKKWDEKVPLGDISVLADGVREMASTVWLELEQSGKFDRRGFDFGHVLQVAADRVVLRHYLDEHAPVLWAAMKDRYHVSGYSVTLDHFKERMMKVVDYDGEAPPAGELCAEAFESFFEKEMENYAHEIRREDMNWLTSGMFDLDSSSGEFIQYFTREKGARCPGVMVDSASLRELAGLFRNDLIERYLKLPLTVPLPDEETVLATLDQMVVDYFWNIHFALSAVSDPRDRGLLEGIAYAKCMHTLTPDRARYTVNFTRIISHVGRILEMTDYKKIRESMKELILSTGFDPLSDAFAFSTEECAALNDVAFLLGGERLRELGNRWAHLILAADSPFIDAAYDVKTELAGDPLNQESVVEYGYWTNLLNLAANRAGERFSPKVDFPRLSLARQRELVGPGWPSEADPSAPSGVYVANGMTEDLGIAGVMPAVNQAVRIDVGDMAEKYYAEAQKRLASKGSAHRGLYSGVMTDIPRDLYVVNGKPIPLKEKDEMYDTFIAAFPNPRDAYQVSTVIHQGMNAGIFSGLLQSTAVSDRIIQNTNFLAGLRFVNTYRIHFLGEGRYRLCSEYCQRSGSTPEKGRENGVPAGWRSRVEVVMETGEKPRIESCTADVLVSGWDQVE